MWNATQWNTFATATIAGSWVNVILQSLFLSLLGYIIVWLWQQRRSHDRFVRPSSRFWQSLLLKPDLSGLLDYAERLRRRPRCSAAPSSLGPDVEHVGVDIRDPPSSDDLAQAHENQSTSSAGERISRDGIDETINGANVNLVSGLRRRNFRRSQSTGDATNDYVPLTQPVGVTEQNGTIREESIDQETPDNWQYFSPQTVGLAARVDELRRLLLNDQRVAIVGFGGMGKSTLAKKLFNTINCPENYDYTGFFLSVKEQWAISNLDMRDKILSNLCKRGKKLKRKNLKWSDLKGKKVLLILDDVNSKDHLPYFMDEFAKASHLVVTSRNDSFLRDFSIYDIEKLDPENSRKLFCSYAFGSDHQDEALQNIVDKLVQKCDGLPLTLESVGSAMYRRNYEIWEEMHGKIKAQENLDGSDENIWAMIIRSCYDVLGPEEKEMFLDVAVLIPAFLMPVGFLEKSRFKFRDLKTCWDRIYKSPHNSWKNLKARRLVRESIGADGEEEIWMHEHFRDLGCKVARSEDTNLKAHLRICLLNDPNRPEYKSKFQDGMEIFLDKSDQGAFNAKAAVILWDKEPCCLHSGRSSPGNVAAADYEPSVDLKVFSRFLDLRFLMLCDVRLIGGHADFPRNLAMLHMDYCHSPGPLPVSFNAERLVDIRVLFRSIPSSFKDIPGLVQALRSPARELRFLHVAVPFCSMIANHYARDELNYNVVELSKCLDPKYLPSLEELTIDEWGVVRLPHSFSNLERLRIVRIIGCDALEELPSFRRLSSLEVLHVRDCPRLKSLPISFGLPASLKMLIIEHCRFFSGDLWGPVIPVGGTSKLQLLTLEDITCSSLPDTFEQLRALERVTFKRCEGLTFLPGSFGGLVALRELNIEKCEELESLDSVSCGGLSALTSLSIRYCPLLKQLPKTFGELSALRDLKIRRNALKSLPETFGNLRALQVLQVEHCYDLETFPVNFGGLSALRSLIIDNCLKLKELPVSFGNLCRLQTLSIVNSKMLVRLPKSFGRLHALTTLKIEECCMLQSLSKEFGLLSSLQNCTFGDCEKLKKLPKSFVHLSALEELSVWNCPFLEPLKCMLSICDIKKYLRSDGFYYKPVWTWKKQCNAISFSFLSLEDDLEFESSEDE